jgi:hypothetical protein
MRFAALATSIVALALYVMLTFRDPAYTLLAPRGGAFTLSVSLVFANAFVWLSGQPTRSPNERFQFAAAAWIWLLVQVGALLYELHLAPSAPVA